MLPAPYGEGDLVRAAFGVNAPAQPAFKLIRTNNRRKQEKNKNILRLKLVVLEFRLTF